MIHSKPLLHRCIPTGGPIGDAYGSIYSWDFAQKVFSDVYTTWPTALMMCCAALGESIILPSI